MLRENYKLRPNEYKSTDARNRGRVNRSSNEEAVMALERRVHHFQLPLMDNHFRGKISRTLAKSKPFKIPIGYFYEGLGLVRKNKGSAGVDDISVDEFSKNHVSEVYKLWNRICSGSYFPAPVLEVAIPKSNGKKRMLGIPTVSDRVAQAVARLMLQNRFERLFDPNSFGFRPKMSQHQAVLQARKNCQLRGWVLDLDIEAFFDTIDHERLMKAVELHVKEKALLLCIRRWLKAPVLGVDGKLRERDKGVPQGGVISPLLANLYLHYTFDAWMRRKFEYITFERYADDIICHCQSLKQAQYVLECLRRRFAEVGLKLNNEKCKIVYCKSYKFQERFDCHSFNFLGFTFKPGLYRLKSGRFKVCFGPGVSTKAKTSIKEKFRDFIWSRRFLPDLVELADAVNPIIRGWIEYFKEFRRSAMFDVFAYFDYVLALWLCRKYKRLKRSKRKARRMLVRIRKQHSLLFSHWEFMLRGWR